MFVESYFQTATHIFEQYELQMPLHLFLKEYFRSNKKFGSRDRKYIAELLYGIYRLGKQNQHMIVKERMLIGSFLSGRLPKLFYDKTDLIFADQYHLNFNDRKMFAEERYALSFKQDFVFSEGMNEADFIKHLFSQPRVFIRIRQNHQEVEKALLKAEIAFEKIQANCFSFESNIKLNEILDDADYVIQDLASQETGTYFSPKQHETWWDSCTASGGKSIMLLDKNPRIELTVTDIREAILKNFHVRMKTYGYESHYVSHQLDLTKEIVHIKQHFDYIICDAPCSGSGTWARSPEQYYFFSEEKLHHYIKLQQQIVANLMPFLKSNGKLFYITCSVFNNENEGLLHELKDLHAFKVSNQKLINKNVKGGDCLFIAELMKD